MENNFESVNNNRRASGVARAVRPGLTLLLILLLAAAALGRLVPSVRDGMPGAKARGGWYFRSGQWQADVRTLAAAFQYIMDDDSDPAIVPSTPANCVAVAEAEAGSDRPVAIRLEADTFIPILSFHSVWNPRPFEQVRSTPM